MTDGSEHRPDRPVRTVRFDDLADSAEKPVRVAAFDDLDDVVAPQSRVTSLEGLVRPGRRAAPATGTDGTAGSGRRRRRAADAPDGRPGDPAAGHGTATPAGPPDTSVDADAAVEPAGASDGAAVAGGTADPALDDGIPPDAPLPRGRRRGGRVGRLGPDAPDPDRPAPDADPVAVAREICLRLLTDRARTRQELAQALARKGVPAEASAAVLDRFDEVGLIDDAAFAEQWVRSRHNHRGLGRRAIAVELRRKGVADEIAGEALAGVDAESEARRARELVDRKLRSLTVDTPERRTGAARRLVGMLARRGYGAGVAYAVVREALADHGADADELDAAEEID